jgi:isoquinoline 1-oxidoreductase beta subunit
LIGIPKDKIVVNNLVLGGGFGRKFNNHAIGEAADLSKRVGKPIKLLWSRECDMQNDLYRPMSEHAFKATIDAQGNLLGWSHQYIQTPGGRGGGDYSNNAYLPYDIPNSGMRAAGAPSPVPTGAWRSVEHSQIIVANECFIDELAVAAGQDPYQFRKKLLKSERVRKVLDSAAQKAGWGEKLPKGMGRGIACFDGYGSCIAHVVDVEVKGREIRVVRMVAVVDPGTAINPRGIEAQVQGGFTDGLATALKAAITIAKGGAVESNWDGYEWARISDSPEMKIYVEPSGGNFGGMGEVGYPSAPAAIANAVFAATGKRTRKFPIKVEELV